MKLLLHIIILVFSILFLVIPLAKTIHYVNDPNLVSNKASAIARDLHRALSPEFASWADQRVQSGVAESLSINNISGTEWPMFSAVYYLWSTEALMQQHYADANDNPKTYAGAAIESAARLITASSTAAWVRKHWGDDYLERENVFYRMLLIAGLTSYQTITENRQYEALLKNQVLNLAQELDDSEYGLLDDYPGQCYPIDIVPAIAVIQRAAKLLDLKLGSFVARSKRGFIGKKLDPTVELPAYSASSQQGFGFGPARGVGVSYMLIWTPELWPELNREWYQRYQRYFLEDSAWLTGVREYTREHGNVHWMGDVDSGPILFGKGVAASAFGIAAARANGDLSIAYKLTVQAVLTAWPLASNRLWTPQILSDLSDAPFIGEAALLFVLTRPIKLNATMESRQLKIPLTVMITMIVLSLVALILVTTSVRALKGGLKNLSKTLS